MIPVPDAAALDKLRSSGATSAQGRFSETSENHGTMRNLRFLCFPEFSGKSAENCTSGGQLLENDRQAMISGNLPHIFISFG